MASPAADVSDLVLAEDRLELRLMVRVPVD